MVSSTGSTTCDRQRAAAWKGTPASARGLRTVAALVAATLMLLVSADPVLAAWLGFRNDTGAPIVVQGANLVNNKPRWGRPVRLLPGEVTWEAILIPGNKVIAVFDINQPNRPLHQEIVNCGLQDQFFSIVLEPAQPATKSQPATGPRIKLEPTTPPARR